MCIHNHRYTHTHTHTHEQGALPSSHSVPPTFPSSPLPNKALSLSLPPLPRKRLHLHWHNRRGASQLIECVLYIMCSICMY